MRYSVGELAFLLDTYTKRENEKMEYYVKSMYDVARFHIENVFAQNPYIKEVPKIEFPWDKERKNNLETIKDEKDFEEFLNELAKKE